MSRISQMIEAIEKGEPVDLRRVLLLQGLDLARTGEQFAEEVLQRDKEFDQHYERIVGFPGVG